MINTHTISILVKNESGVLQRLSSLFTRRRFNIESITVGKSINEKFSRVIIVTTCNDKKVVQIISQLGKMIDVLEIEYLIENEMIALELALVKVDMKNTDRKFILDIITRFDGSIIDERKNSIVFGIMGDTHKINYLIRSMDSNLILDFSRTGITAMSIEV